ncbi:MAG: acyl-CoA synthetase (NDP forming) [Halieaceae bacterium]|jgi:acyl-CoA synthetase (NDP forming)
MAIHRLDPLLRPRSIAVVGASAKPGSPGNEVLVNLAKGGYGGHIYAVNPGRDEVDELPCFASLSDLPQIPDHVVFAVSDNRLEALFDEALVLGVRAATLFSSLAISGETGSGLKHRILRKAEAARLLLHGGNSMGFFNFCDRVWVSGFDTRAHSDDGNVVLLSQSGAGMSGIMDCEGRLNFCFAASTGQELCIGVEDYLEFVLDLPQTRVIGLFLETSRQPRRLLKALAKAQEKRIPIVAIKVGKTAFSARLAVSHSGALAGTDASYQAVFDRYGVQRVDDMTELATALIMFAQPNGVAPGSLVSLHDSGGERQLAIDVAEQLKVPFTVLSEQTCEQLAQDLGPGLPAVNPLDGWGGGENAGSRMAACFSTLLADEGAALGAVVHDRAPESSIYPAYLDYCEQARIRSDKPVFLVSNHQGSGSDPLAVAATERGIPVVDGLRPFLVGVRCLLNYRDFIYAAEAKIAPGLPQERIQYWLQRLTETQTLTEHESAQLLAEYDIPMNPGHTVTDSSELESVCSELEFPVVLKTAVPGLAHKTEVAGIHLNLANFEQLLAAYQELSNRLGSQALVASMIDDPGLEILLGVSADAQFGPVVIIALGGVQAELMAMRVSLLPPFSADRAKHILLSSPMGPMFGGFRGGPALAIDQLCAAAERLSVLAVELSDALGEIDINPLLVTHGGCMGLDALVVSRGP